MHIEIDNPNTLVKLPLASGMIMSTPDGVQSHISMSTTQAFLDDLVWLQGEQWKMSLEGQHRLDRIMHLFDDQLPCAQSNAPGDRSVFTWLAHDNDDKHLDELEVEMLGNV